MTEWKMKGEYIKNCNCAPGCPCDFWAPPTHHKCEGMLAMRITEGHFGVVPLAGLSFAGTYHWPGPLHEGNGTMQPFISQAATSEQRNAILTILSGKAGNAWFEVVASVISTVLEPKFVEIEFSFDLIKRSARVAIPGEFETVTEPIKNLATGDEHHIRVDMPKGMEYFRPEIATARVLRSTGQIGFDCAGGHSSMALVIHTQAGLQA
ncbi:MAG: DUF1326 domain-containing protein [Terriglobales bacterium]